MKFTDIQVKKNNNSPNTNTKKKKGQPYPNGSFGMPKAGRGLDALNNMYRKD